MHFFGSDVVAPGTGSLLPINERGLFLENQSKLWKNMNIFWRSKVKVFCLFTSVVTTLEL